MEKKQQINCTVNSCIYKNTANKLCELEAIMVQPCNNCNNGNPAEESMCASYKHIK